MEQKRPVAVCDIDGTIFRSSLLVELVLELVRRELFPKRMSVLCEGFEGELQNKRGEYGPFMRKLIDGFAASAKGIEYGAIADIAGELIEENRGRTFQYTRDLIRDLKQKGYFLLAVSYSPKFMVDGFAYELGFDKSYGVFYDIGASSRFSGEIVDEHLIMNKGAILDRAIKRNNLTLHGSLGIGSTESDISLLDMTEASLAFNPNRVLYRHAKQKHWELVVEHKNVIYEM